MASLYDLAIGPTQSDGFFPEGPQKQPLTPEQMMMQMFEKFMGQQQQQPPNPMDAANADIARLTALRNDPQGDRNRGYVPGVDNAQSPFSNGFFKSMDERQAIEQSRLGMPGFSSLSPGQQAGALSTNMPQDRAAGAMAASQSPWSGMSALLGATPPMPLTSPWGNSQSDAANLQQNFEMYAPGGMSRQKKNVGMKASGSPLAGFKYSK